MTAPFFFSEDDDLAARVVGDVVTLSGDEGRHAVTVKRMAVGEHLLVGDGHSAVLHATVQTIHSKTELAARVNAVELCSAPSPRVTVVQALIKGERMERAVETLTEAGVDRIILWQSQRAIVRLDQSAAQKTQSKLAIRAQQAAKQARRPIVPTITTVVKAPELIDLVVGDSRLLILHEDAKHVLSDVLPPLPDASMNAQDIVLVVGPEGGLSPEEVELLESRGGTTVGLGNSVMRASTAGTVALGWVMGAVGRWSVAD